MENGVEALKIVFGMIIFVLAISVAISCFTQATQAMQRIWEMQQADESYVTDVNGNYLNYVDFSGGNRIVSAETIVPNMYRAYKENFAIYFYESNAGVISEYTLYEKDGVSINYVDLLLESYANEEAAIEQLKNLLEGGLYERIAQNTFIEYLGEYYLEDVSGVTNTPEANKNKKRVIAYVLNN